MKLLFSTLLAAISSQLALAAENLPKSLETFVDRAESLHGETGKRAALHLVAHMPQDDAKSLDSGFLIENLNLAFQARRQFPWASQVSEERFINDVLPYAVLDEPRYLWREDFIKLAAPIVAEARTADEAVQVLNQKLFDQIGVEYNTGRKRANQSPKESIAQGKASCTGLSIILVYACRAVGIPARAVGIPLWPDRSGNHTWVEIHDGQRWRYTGAAEYTPKGLDHAWFTKRAALAQADKALHSIYASSWEAKNTHFPLPWAPRKKSVGAIKVTDRYTGGAAINQPHQVGIRLFADSDRGSRIAATGRLISEDGALVASFTTKAGTTDLNDMPQLPITPGQSYWVAFKLDGQILRSGPIQPKEEQSIIDLYVEDLKPTGEPGLSKEAAAQAVQTIYRELVEAERTERLKELQDKSITLGEHTLKWMDKTFGDAPDGERSLWISMHGGGGAPAQVNTQQWQNQIKLYQPEEGIYLAPRAPTDTWNLWHQSHIDPLFARLIENMVAYRGVDPDKVYLMGYSAGGDGVWQLGPRMADRFAAAAMMAGHPNEAKLLGLRNLPFGIFCGALDRAYKRNEVCAQRMEEIAELAEADSGGYPHMTRLYENTGHWMNLKDAEALPWMAGFSRHTWPEKIVWYQDDVTHDRFYWIQLPEGAAQKGQRIDAAVEGQTITLKGDIPSGTRLLLHDDLIDLDQPVKVSANDGEPTTYHPKRSAAVIRQALQKRLDPSAAPTARIIIE